MGASWGRLTPSEYGSTCATGARSWSRSMLLNGALRPTRPPRTATRWAGLDLAAEGVAAFEQRTEGWFAAIQLAARSIQGES